MAVTRLSEFPDGQVLIAEFTRHENAFLRQNAVLNLKDKTILAKMADNDSDISVRSAAKKRLDDLVVKQSVAEKYDSKSVLIMSFLKLDNRTLLEEFARKYPDPLVRHAASERLANITNNTNVSVLNNKAAGLNPDGSEKDKIKEASE